MKKPTMDTLLIKPGFWGRKRTVDFGKFDFYGCGRRINSMDADIRLYDEHGDGNVVLSIIGGIWNARHSDLIEGGDCLDTMKKFINTPVFNKVYGWWKMYHRNDMHYGDERQEKYLLEKGIDISNPKPRIVLPMLRAAGLEKDSDGYLFGGRFYFHPIPPDVLNEIKAFISEDPAY